MQAQPPSAPGPLAAAGVTRRESEVLRLVGERLRNREIAERLFLSERTVESHISSLLAKLNAADRQALVDLAARLHSPVRVGSLPEPLSSFHGRGRETEELHELVSSHRLVTLTGAAGSGKTRLALAVAASVKSLPPPVLVDLAVLPPGSDVERAFATGLGVTADESRLRDALRDAIAHRPYWILVDNCEHVTESTAGLLADLLASTSQLRVLATSHAPLGVPGEVAYRVLPLHVPPETDNPAAVLAAPAGELFAERAATSSPGFTITADNARDVAAICRRLDGLPLAIELAAARVRVFSPRELLAHIDERFELLTGGVTTGANRHVSLKAALRWSYELLDHDEQILLERCSVFPAEFEYGAVAGAMTYEPLGPSDLVGLFPRLLDRSLIFAIPRGDATDYRMLDSVRQFSADQLVARGGLERARAEHARYHLVHGGSLLSDLQGRNQPDALGWIERRWADVRVAMDWALATGKPELAWTFIAGIGAGWDVLGIRGELFDWLDALLKRPLPTGPLGVRSAAAAAFVLWYQDVDRAIQAARLASDLAQQQNGWNRAFAALVLGRCEHAAEAADAVSHLKLAAAEFRRQGDDWHYAVALEFLSEAVPDTAETLRTLGKAADLFGRMGDRVMRANCLNQIAQHSIELDAQLDVAEACLAEAYELAVQTGNQHERLHAEMFRAQLDQRRGDVESAGPRFRELLDEFRRIGDYRCVSRCLFGLGAAALAAGELRAAGRLLIDSIQIASRDGGQLRLAAGLRLLAHVEHQSGEYLYAARLLGAADAAAARIDEGRRAALPPDVGIRAALETELRREVFLSAMSEARSLPVGQLVAFPERLQAD